MLTILLFFAIFGVIIILHELGHFYFARRYGVTVKYFTFGFGPRIIGKRIGDTDFRISLIPLGGAVKLLGETPWENVPEGEREGAFSGKTLGQKLTILLGGPGVNIIIGFVFFLALNLSGGVRLPANLIIESVASGSPAAVAGILPADKVVAVDGKKLESWAEFKRYIEGVEGKPLNMALLRNGESVMATLVPAARPEGGYTLGFRSKAHKGPAVSGNSFVAAITQAGRATLLTFSSLADSVEKAEMSKLGGPVRIATEAERYLNESFSMFVFFFAFISLNLGLLNLLPIPALDGGYIFYLLAEKITGRSLGFRAYRVIMSIGFGLIFALMLAAFRNDIFFLLGP